MADDKKIRLGALNVGEYSFWGIWAEALAQQGPFGTSLFNMELTHCWETAMAITQNRRIDSDPAHLTLSNALTPKAMTHPR